MNIGIISMQRLVNFGSYLQAWGLKHILEEMGHSVEFIDIKLENGSFMNLSISAFRESRLKKIARRILKGEIYSLSVERNILFRSRYFPEIGLSEVPNERTDYDAVVIGSDEVFSYCQFTQWGGTAKYFGQGIDSDRIVSYAGSFGYTTLQDLRGIGMDQTIGSWLQDFTGLSVRDQNSYDIIQRLTGRDTELHLDPVLIYPFREEIPEVLDKDYILVYGYDERLVEPEYVEPIRAFARKHKKKLYAVGFFQSWCDKQINCSPFEVLGYVRKADYVICETFHGTIFSIKYQKQFAAIVRDSNRNKLMDLLNRFSLCDRQFSGREDLETILTASYDKERVRKQIEHEREKTKQYFEKYL